MGCSSCRTSEPAGCKNNGYCNSGGCNKFNVFDWLSDMDTPRTGRFNVVEVRFKNGRKGYYQNDNELDIVTGDAVVVGAPGGHHIGYVSLQGELVRIQLKKKKVKDNDQLRIIYRKATGRDMQRWEEAKNKEMSILYRTREIVQGQQLSMKMTDAEFQADGTKVTFYYSAEERIDFRELIRIMAGEFKIRVEMKHISLREEAGRIGGVGICGRELCCSTWLSGFKSVTTQAARYQSLSVNPDKLSGQCGRLKCCLNYELDTYMEALADIPEVHEPLLTKKGAAELQKTDIFRKIMWFCYRDDDNWHPLGVKRVREIQELNKKGEQPATLPEDEVEEGVKTNDTPINHDLEMMDRKFNKRRKQKRNNMARKNKIKQVPNDS